MNREEVKQILREKKIKKALRCYRGRFLKNLFIWLVGMITCVALLAGGVFVGVKLVPIKTFTGSHTEEYVSEDVGNLSVFDAIMGIKSYGVSDFPIIEKTLSEMLTSSGAGNYISIDFDKLRTVKFTYSEPGKTLVSELQSCVKVTASINSIGGVSMLGDIGNLSVFSEYEEVTEAVDPTAEGFNAKLYYYKTEVDGTDVYKRAFTDEGAYVDGVTGSTTLYYPNLADIPLMEAKDVLTDSFSRLKALNMLQTMGANVTDDIIVNLLGNKTIKELANLNQDTIKLTDFIPAPDSDNPNRNRALYDMVRQASDCETNDDITLRKLTQMNINKVYLSNVLGDPDSENQDLYDLLVDATGKTWDNIRLEDLTNNPDLIKDLKLTTVLKDEDDNGDPINEKLYALLRDLTNSATNDEITVGALSSGINIDNVKLTVILPDEDGNGDPINEKLYALLRDLTNSATNDEITVAALSSGINIDDVKLTVILPDEDGNGDPINEKLYELLRALTNSSTNDEITVGSLSSGISVDDVKLTALLPDEDDNGNPQNETLYSILRSATGASTNDDITINSLSSGLDLDNVQLTVILPDEDDNGDPINEKLYNILRSATGAATNDAITVGSLSAGINIDNVKLTEILPDEDDNGDPINEKLYNILRSATGAASNDAITVGSLSAGIDIDNVQLTELLPDEDGNGNPVNEKLYSILRSATGAATNDAITVGSLSSGINIDNVKLTVILPDEDDNGNPLNEKLYNILRSATGAATNDAITVGSLSAGIDIDNVSLTAVLPYDSGTEQLYGIIQDMTGLSYADVTVSSLTSFDVSLIKLGTVFAESSNENLYKLLADAVTLNPSEASVADITLGSLNSRLNIQNIRLGTILDGVTVTNRVLLSIKEKNVRISELGATLDALTLTEVFGDRSVFSTTVNGAEYYYNEETDTYILASSVGNVLPDGYEDGYYIASDASVWLFMMYQAEEVGGIKHDNDGYALKYTGTGITFGQMSSAMGDVASDMMHSTIRELVIAGMVDGSSFGSSNNIYKYTMQQAMNMLANAMNTYPGFFS